MTQINYKEEYEKAIEIINYFMDQGLCIKSVKVFPNDKIEKLDKILTDANLKIKEVLGEYNETKNK